MTTIRTAEAEWKGSVPEGAGTVALGSGIFKGDYGFRSRMGDGAGGTNPEELLGAAHAACFSMALSLALSKAGHAPTRLHTDAKVHLDKNDSGYEITLIELVTEAEAPGLDGAKFKELAEATKTTCPVSKALASVKITLEATLV